MPRDLSDVMDDYCVEKYGHSNWGYLNSYTKEDLVDESKYDIEDNKVFWYEETREVEFHQC
tara:strand:+ start:2027 stop:2209 length:183 start_codon:yes stop_codon:yes gene_type:complete